MKIHVLKCHTDFYRQLESGHKRCEIRKDDRDYGIGDYLFIKNPDKFPDYLSFRVTAMCLTRTSPKVCNQTTV